LIKNAFPPDYIESMRQSFTEEKKAYFQDKEFTDALIVGDK